MTALMHCHLTFKCSQVFVVEISLQSHTYVLLNLLSLYVVCWHLWMHKMGGLCHGKEILSIRGYISWLTHVCLKLKSSSIIVFLFEANGTSHGVRSVCVILLCICTSPVLFSLRGSSQCMPKGYVWQGIQAHKMEIPHLNFALNYTYFWGRWSVGITLHAWW
jgi:hypothetical protein